MPMPQTDLINELQSIGNELGDVSTAIEALPPTPLEGDLPAIVQIVNDLVTTTGNLKSSVDTIVTILTTTRVNQ